MPIAPIEGVGVDFLIEEALNIDTAAKQVVTESQSIGYEKLILATGSTPFVPPIPGIKQEGVFTVPKNYTYLTEIADTIKQAKNIVVIGAGFIGVEVSDELRQNGNNVTLVEGMNRVLPLAFDEDISAKVAEQLEKNGLNIKTGAKVKQIVGSDNHVTGVELESGEILDADAVVVSIGYRPNTKLAADADLFMGRHNAIWTDEYQRTSVEDIFAVGDCAEHKDYFTRKPTRLMLASTAAFDGRIAGMSLYGLKIVKKNQGNISIFSSAIEGLAMGAAGITEATAKEEGFEIVVGSATAVDRHPGKIEDVSPQTVKLIFSKSEGVLLGAQVITGKSAGELINVLGIAIQQSMTAIDLVTLQVGTHPLLTASPVVYPAILAAKPMVRELCNR
jgi:NADPH-dependent 2,4-dienoyl-CoA reductase/sulfur reductase-like enzyme